MGNAHDTHGEPTPVGPSGASFAAIAAQMPGIDIVAGELLPRARRRTSPPRSRAATADRPADGEPAP